MYLAIIEQFLFWGGLLVFLVSLAMYAGRTKDYKSLVEFWKPTINMTKREFDVNRAGLTMMIVAVAIRIINFLI
ncbi:hypothetical protein WNY58_13060 [Neptuniibacter pectenicola]|jgi:hypothetical protein|uniref:Uncharacterized protein n=1 Tax=Neptuniibacter pectenicola TaxID=1806669 RepID=A0ABU9TVP7_9GAMM|nr:hypothetical protein [Neptuniibacter pectenicola]KXJ52196.1 MAG: hypothetical protein AXW15_03895 [Neptuniibacter sp. Phe_28]|tara:strand:+ start:7500 stop:7721 length:222 start_codon:yes stop_codon:yes gene_type:complete